MMLRALGLKEKKCVNHEPKVSDSDTFLAFSQPLAKVTGLLNHTKYGVSFYGMSSTEGFNGVISPKITNSKIKSDFFLPSWI